MDPVLLITLILGPAVTFAISTVKSVKGTAQLKKLSPYLRSAGQQLITAADQIDAKAKKRK